jgi:signal transduction histidine kinase
VDINALCDEYLRLSFHGMRAKDKSFQAEYTTDFDPALPPVLVLPQEIGRVLLNLINNAFYAVQMKASGQHDSGYKPLVKIKTEGKEGGVRVLVIDNGSGIPKEIKDKIFQPFFTTKPTGQGTGLGLSLAYEIVTKGHGGELSVQSREGEGTTFRVDLPVGEIEGD